MGYLPEDSMEGTSVFVSVMDLLAGIGESTNCVRILRWCKKTKHSSVVRLMIKQIKIRIIHPPFGLVLKSAMVSEGTLCSALRLKQKHLHFLDRFNERVIWVDWDITHHSIALVDSTACEYIPAITLPRSEYTRPRQTPIARGRPCCDTCNLYCTLSPKCTFQESYWLGLEWVEIWQALPLERPALVPLRCPPIFWSNLKNHPRLDSRTSSR